MPITSPDNIYYPDTSTTASIVNIGASIAASVQNALDSRKLRSFVWANSSARTNQSGMASGDTGIQLDTNTNYVYLSGSWVTNRFLIDQGIVTPYTGGSAIPTGTTLSTIVIPSVTVSSLVIFTLVGQAGNTSGADQTGSLQFVSTAGTPNALTTETIDIRNSKWNSIPLIAYMNLPANTAATVTFRTASSASLLFKLSGTYSRTAT